MGQQNLAYKGVQPTPVAQNGFLNTSQRRMQGNPASKQKRISYLRRSTSPRPGSTTALPKPASKKPLHVMEKSYGVNVQKETPRGVTPIKKNFVGAAAAHFDQFEDRFKD